MAEDKTNGEASTAAPAKENNNKKEKKEQKPIEELYDLSKPIPRVSW